MTQRYNCNDRQRAFRTWSNGFAFGRGILHVESATALNELDEGWSATGKDRYYDVEGDMSPLTNQKVKFTCAELEVYKVLYE